MRKHTETMPRPRQIRRRRYGRQRGFTPRKRRLLYAVLEKTDLPYKRACELVGISYQTFAYWMQRGKVEDEPLNTIHVAFRARIKRIEARKEAELLCVIDKVAVGDYKVRETEISFHPDKGRSYKRKTKVIRPDWKAAAWRLERKFPDQYFLKDDSNKGKTPEEIASQIRQASEALWGSVPISEEAEAV